MGGERGKVGLRVRLGFSVDEVIEGRSTYREMKGLLTFSLPRGASSFCAKSSA